MKNLNINRNKIIAYLIVIIVICSRYIFMSYKFNNAYTTDKENKTYEVKIVEIVEKTDKKISYMVKLNNDKFILNIYKSDYTINNIKINNYSDFEYGDIVKVEGRIKIPKYYNNKGEFNYKKYLNSKNIYGYIACYVNNKDDIKKVENTNKKISLLSLIYKFKAHISDSLDENLGNLSGFAKGIIYGDTSNLDDSVKENFEKLGISHILSASGSNIATIILVLSYANIKIISFKSSKALKHDTIYKKRKTQNIINFIILFCIIIIFNVISSFELSIIRASIMLVISMVFKLFNKKISKYKSMLIAFLIMIFIYPYCIYNVGVNLSFLATVGIISFQKDIYNYLKEKTLKIKKIFKKNIVKKILNYILILTSITISAQILIIPVQIENFNEISLNILSSNILVSFFDVPIRLIGILGIIFSFIKPISNFLFKCLNPLLYILNLLIKSISKCAICLNIMSLPFIIYFGYYLLILFIYIYVNTKKYTVNIIIIKKRKKLIIFALILFIITISGFCVYRLKLDNYVTFFNVSQGDMAYIKYKDKSILIDCGSKVNNLSTNIIKSYLKKQNINHIDLVIISHFHEDHVNGIKELLDNVKIEKMICAYQQKFLDTNELNDVYDDYIEIKKCALDKNVKFIETEKGDEFFLEDIYIQILSPKINEKFEDDFVNASSLVCNINIKNKNYLFMGDASSETEDKILNFLEQNLSNIYILKVGHHGSKSSTSDEFLKVIKPKIGIITACKEYYGHPSEETLLNLNNNKVKTFQTEIFGQITFKIN